MTFREVVERAQDALTVRRVYGEPYEHDGALVIPAAAVRGGGGGGGGSDAGSGEGEGAGFGLSARPVGVFVIKGDTQTWKPAIDVTRMFVMACTVAVAFAFAGSRIARTALKRR